MNAADKGATLLAAAHDIELAALARSGGRAAFGELVRRHGSAVRALLKTEANGRSFRLIGAGLSDLIEADAVEADFFSGEARRLSGEKAVDSLRARFGPSAVVAARLLRRNRPSKP